jgi:hypothetical protein
MWKCMSKIQPNSSHPKLKPKLAFDLIFSNKPIQILQLINYSHEITPHITKLKNL